MDRPLHIYDLLRDERATLTTVQHPALGDHWYWCRAHHRPEHSNWAMIGCVRVGPFMTEAEAQVCATLPGDIGVSTEPVEAYQRPPRTLTLPLADPGAFVKRRHDLGPERDEIEPLVWWQARALQAALGL